MSELLTVAEHSTLTECEAVIERGLNTFVEVGQALARVRNERLYRAEHGTFKEYLADRWGMTEQRGYQLMDAAAVTSTIVESAPELPPPSNEAQARELARVPEAQRAEVWQRVVTETDGKPTAAAIGQVAAQGSLYSPEFWLPLGDGKRVQLCDAGTADLAAYARGVEENRRRIEASAGYTADYVDPRIAALNANPGRRLHWVETTLFGYSPSAQDPDEYVSDLPGD